MTMPSAAPDSIGTTPDDVFRLDVGPGLDAGKLADDTASGALDLELGDAAAPDFGPGGLGDADATPAV